VGAATVVGELRRLADRYGPRFEPADCLIEMTGAHRTFHA
jgi:hypothetical protein